ncbi:MAG: hypothetical protein U9P80_02850 [Thermodesulfobacteriota bacterium]|nr:hypothetical protein [Thermodesulfobacteriota bacterium]
MKHKESSSLPTPSNSHGWVFIYVLIFITIICGASLASMAMVKTNIRSSGAFRQILQGTNPVMASGEKPCISHTTLDAPEGWDHAYFATDLIQNQTGTITQIAWRARMDQPPSFMTQKPILASPRPYVIMLIDDSESMNWSCGKDYTDDALYIKRRHKDITGVYPGIVDSGLSFKGDWCNDHYCAPLSAFYGGKMSSWTFLWGILNRLIDELAVSDIAIATTSRGEISCFGSDIQDTKKAIIGIYPSSPTSPLSEALRDALAMFPEECPTQRHILIFTDGHAHTDGDLPQWLKDYDADNEDTDRYIKGMGCTCLDDVASYAASLGIHVHTAGPDSAFLRKVASKGNGVFMPEENDLQPEVSFTSQVRAGPARTGDILKNISTGIDTSNITMDTSIYYNRHMEKTAAFGIYGNIVSVYTQDKTAYCTTSLDLLLSIDLNARSLNWVAQGPGGIIRKKGPVLIVGPNHHGRVYLMNTGPKIISTIETGAGISQENILDASMGCLYFAKGNTISCLDIKNGSLVHSFTSNNRITALRYDPFYGCLFASTDTGIILSLDQNLHIKDILASGAGTTIEDIHCFHHSKTAFILAQTRTGITCLENKKIIWSKKIRSGEIGNIIVMGSRVFLTIQDHGRCPCPGMDTGGSRLMVIDALNGETIDTSRLFDAMAFGPLIDLDTGIMEYIDYRTASIEYDLGEIRGVSPVYLGRRIEHGVSP